MPISPLIVIGTSAGGVSALSTLIGGLPNDLHAPVCIARHADPTRESLLPQILSRVGTLTVAPFPSGASLLPGQLFVAPAGHHLRIEHTRVNVFQEQPKRPRDDIDRLFQSAAASYGCQIIAVILTGRLTDGTVGLQTVKQQGDITIIQDPEEAAFPSMPQSAQAQCAIDYCLPLAHIALLLPRLLEAMASQRSQMENVFPFCVPTLKNRRMPTKEQPCVLAATSHEQQLAQWRSRYHHYLELREDFLSRQAVFAQQQARWRERKQAYQMRYEALERAQANLVQHRQLTARPF